MNIVCSNRPDERTRYFLTSELSLLYVPIVLMVVDKTDGLILIVLVTEENGMLIKLRILM